MSRFDLHTHTTFSDGRNTPEEMVQAAIAKGLDTIGISDHSYTFFDESYCMAQSGITEYRRTLQGLKEKYSGQIRVLCGIEQDFYSTESTAGYDYVIGSVHYLKADDVFIPVDETPEILMDAAKAHFGGDFYRLCQCYFHTVSQMAAQPDINIIGHFDLIEKFNEGNRLFDPADPRYLEAAQAAARKLVTAGKIFECNTGAVSRGYRTVPYPAPSLAGFLKQNGAAFIPSSDSHQAETRCFGFEELIDIPCPF